MRDVPTRVRRIDILYKDHLVKLELGVIGVCGYYLTDMNML